MSSIGRYLEPELIQRLNHLQLSARRVVEGVTTGQHRSPLKGASIEFRQHRFYAPGDEPRRLDWRVLARTDRPYIKEYDEETNLRCLLLLDASGSMAYRSHGISKFDYASKLVAAMAYLMLGQTESVGTGVIAKRLEYWISPKAGVKQLSRLLETIESLRPRGKADLVKATEEAAARLGRRALVVVVSDFLSPADRIRQGLAQLHHARHEVIAIRVLSTDEAEFPFTHAVRLQGLEGERARVCEPALVRKTYLENFARHSLELQETCRLLSVDLAQFFTDRPMIESLTKFLHRRLR